MKLYYTAGSPYARIVRILILEKGLQDRVELVPAQVRSTTAGLIIGGGRNTGQPPNLTSTEIAIGAQLARAAGTVSGALRRASSISGGSLRMSSGTER